MDSNECSSGIRSLIIGGQIEVNQKGNNQLLDSFSIL